MDQHNFHQPKHFVGALLILLASYVTPSVSIAENIWIDLQAADRILSAGPIPVPTDGSVLAALMMPTEENIKGNVYILNGSGNVVAHVEYDSGDGTSGSIGELIQALVYRVTYDSTNGELSVVDSSGAEPIILYQGAEPDSTIGIFVSLNRAGGKNEAIQLSSGTLILHSPGSNTPIYMKMDVRESV